MIDKSAKILVCGHRGMVGSACVRKFEKEGYAKLDAWKMYATEFSRHYLASVFFSVIRSCF